MLRAIGLGVVLFGFWLLLSGHYTPLLTTLGVASCVLVVYICVRMDVVDHEAVAIHGNRRFALYVPWLMKEIFLANVAVAKIILSPGLPISPNMIRLHGTQRTDLGKALYANSITLTPGTITTGVEGSDFQVHALTAADIDPEDFAEMDRRCTWVDHG